LGPSNSQNITQPNVNTGTSMRKRKIEEIGSADSELPEKKSNTEAKEEDILEDIDEIAIDDEISDQKPQIEKTFDGRLDSPLARRNALCSAAENGRLEVVKHLSKFNAVRVWSNCALRCAAANGHLGVVKYLLKFNAVRDEITAWDNYALRHAAWSGHLGVVKYLLKFNAVRDEIAAGNNEALRRAAAYGHIDVVNELLQYDAVVQNITAGHNYALRHAQEALSLDPPEEKADRLRRVIDRLMAFPAVRDYEIQHQDEVPGLAEMADDAEGSMQLLDRGQQGQVAALEKYYGECLNKRGNDNVLNDLKKYMKEQYEKNPAVYIDGSGEKHTLPLEYDETLPKEAHKLYYQNPFHTAWRYFLSPNPWISPTANFVHHLEGEGAEASKRAEDLPLLALLWLAASDETMDTPEYTIENRKELFAQGMHGLARGHNLDERTINGETTTEDDLEEDKPSCGPGVRQRLMSETAVSVYNSYLQTPESRNLSPKIIIDKFQSEIVTGDGNILSRLDKLGKDELELLNEVHDGLIVLYAGDKQGYINNEASENEEKAQEIAKKAVETLSLENKNLTEEEKKKIYQEKSSAQFNLLNEASKEKRDKYEKFFTPADNDIKRFIADCQEWFGKDRIDDTSNKLTFVFSKDKVNGYQNLISELAKHIPDCYGSVISEKLNARIKELNDALDSMDIEEEAKKMTLSYDEKRNTKPEGDIIKEDKSSEKENSKSPKKI